MLYIEHYKHCYPQVKKDLQLNRYKDSLDIKLNKITDSIEAIYDYSYKKNPKLLDTQFADWYCQNSFL
jgi:hypothetical protein